MEEGAKKRRGGRPRGQRIDVWVTPQEYAAIADKARQTGLSHSAYMRAMALNTPVRSIVDLGAVDHLVRVHGDLGRVPGLLKLWLAERRGIGAHPVDVEAMMKDFQSLQREMLELMGRIVFDRPHSS